MKAQFNFEQLFLIQFNFCVTIYTCTQHGTKTNIIANALELCPILLVKCFIQYKVAGVASKHFLELDITIVGKCIEQFFQNNFA